MIFNAMNVLLVAATTLEIKPFLDHFRQNVFERQEVDVLISGPGLMTATHSLTRQIGLKKPDLVIQAGIAGCFNKNMPLGSIVAVKQEVVADEGVVEEKKFKTLFDLKLVKGTQFPYKNGWLVNPNASKLIKGNGFKVVNGVTVNQITTDPRKAKEYVSRYKAVVESMEGAALHYVCLQSGISFLQLRGVSNYIGERNKAKWDFQKPIQNLNKALITMLEK
jgi:futalosine hydrolase